MIDVLSRLNEALAGRYVVESELGRGGMATVYLARDTKHDRLVALKVFRPELAAAVGPARFLNEVQVTARLQHPHILPLHDSGEAQGFLYYVMPYVEGETLRARMTREGQLPLDDAVHITRQVADALAYAHSRNVVHRDVKPENILLQGEHALVADFGVARAIEAAGMQRVTAAGLAVGTPAYMSPEQASGVERVDGRSDVYSLAAVLYEMLGGEPPHTGITPQAILARQLSDEVRSLRPLRTTVTPQLDGVLKRALAPAPADRYTTAHDFSAAVRGAVRASAAARAVQTIAVKPRQLVIVATLVLALAAAAWLILRRDGGAGVGRVELNDGRIGVAVFPFRGGGAGGDEWGEPLADLLATALDGTPGVRIADPWSLWQALRPTRGARAAAPDPEEAERLSREAQTGHFVLGSVVENSGKLDVTMRVYRAGAGEPLQAILATGATDSLSDLVQRIAVQLISSIWAERDSAPRIGTIERYATRSADALKAYLDARVAMRRGQVGEAEQSIDRALALDSSFALALVEAVRIKSWAMYMRGQGFSGILALAQRALELGDSLSERQRLRAAWAVASVRTEGVAAGEAAERLVRLDGTDLDAWDALSYTRLVYGWQYGATAALALQAAERVTELDPRYVPGLLRRAWLAAAGGDEGDRRRQLGRLTAVDTSNAMVRGAMLGLELLLADSSQVPTVAERVAREDAAAWLGVLRQLRPTAPERAEQLLTRLDLAAGPGFPQRLVTGARAQLAASAGRVAEIDSAIRADAYAELGGFARVLDLYLVASAIAGIGNERVTERALDRLAAFVPPDSALAYFETRSVWSTAWAIGAWHAMYGDTAVTKSWREVIGTLPCCGGTSENYVASLQYDLDARIAARQGQLDTALVLARRAYDLWTIHTENVLESQPEPAMRLHLGLLLAATGRPDSAEAILSSLVPPTTWLGFLTARASLELGELAEARGAMREAAAHFEAALALWRLGGLDVREWRDRAEAGLERARRRGG